MANYRLLYWPIPFRGQFLRAMLAYASQTWEEASPDEIGDAMSAPPSEQPVPFVGPPVLVDREQRLVISQMPAIAWYLGTRHGLLPADVGRQALTLKVIGDANDVLDELTLDGGKQMWTPKRWAAFEPRLRRWMGMWEALGRQHGLHADKGTLLGTDRPGAADIVTATLWSTMTDRFPVLGEWLAQEAPMTSGLCQRLQALPPLEATARRAREAYGSVYCGGRIERSLRHVLDHPA